MAQDNRTPQERLGDAEANYRRALSDCGKIRGCAGGWRAESVYQAASRQLYDARIDVGYELTKRNRKGVYYILSVPEELPVVGTAVPY